MPVSVPLSLLDLSRVNRGESVAEGIARSVRLAQTADGLGYHRLWFAEHHNAPNIASSATALVIGHVAGQTQNLRLGAGGIMLPNHSPLVIAEQFGTLETLYPGRIDLGLGRAPGTDGQTMRALRRDGHEAERFPSDVLELHAYLSDQTRVAGVNAYPGAGTHVPLYILGSSLFGAQLAAQFGLPYAFASHFAPAALNEAAQIYRETFDPSGPLAGPAAKPHFIAAANVIAADDAATAHEQRRRAEDGWLDAFLNRGSRRPFSPEDLVAVRQHPQAQQILRMLERTFVGTQAEVTDRLAAFVEEVQADELILVNLAPSEEHQRRTLELLAPHPG
ncbi:putative luciferase-like protein [Deinococcus piscis]|uniref:Luciferase-like protein n=1 Tax=Deinococcus piscis TaxID=394230 RepID=A0ABQ3K2L3_9DEIO|nr:LLM class flavin-dependent oxidoreductase [Deinococcus piscis]GHF97192.1 putative luciferase-like protein [Deinococcus piscis]